METNFSYRKQKSSSLSENFTNNFTPLLITTDAQFKYHQLKHCLIPGAGIAFNSFPHLSTKIHNIGWESFVIFANKHIYPSLIAEFYSHMVFNKDANGILTSINTCIQDVDYVIDEQLLLHALHLRPTMLSLPKINPYVYPIDYSVFECLNYKQNLAIVTDQIVPALLFDFPVPIGVEFLTAESQFLAKIIKQNFMPVRTNSNLLPCDLQMMSCILNEFMPYNLPFFLLTSFEHCYQNNCMGYGLLLSNIFQYLGININSIPSQLVNNSNLISHLYLPPRPLSIFKMPNQENFQTHRHMLSHLESLTSMHQLTLVNQASLMTQIEDMKQTIHHLKDMVHLLLENQKLSIPPYHFSASQSSANPDFMNPATTDALLPPIGMNFSPINLEDF